MNKNHINSHHLNSDLLRAFLAIAEAGSISGAADVTYRTQSAVSLQLQRLERIVGQPVFRRLARGVRLTAAGETLMPVARQVISSLDGVVSRLQEPKLSGSLRIGIPDEYSSTKLPGILARFSKENPAVTLTVRCSASAAFPDLLTSGDLDLALYIPDRLAAHHRVLLKDGAVWAAAEDAVAPAETPFPIAFFDRSCWWRDAAIAALDRSGVPYRATFTSDSVAGVRAAIASGMAFGVLPESALDASVRAVPDSMGLPPIGETYLVMASADDADNPVRDAMAAEIAAAFA